MKICLRKYKNNSSDVRIFSVSGLRFKNFSDICKVNSAELK